MKKDGGPKKSMKTNLEVVFLSWNWKNITSPKQICDNLKFFHSLNSQNNAFFTKKCLFFTKINFKVQKKECSESFRKFLLGLVEALSLIIKMRVVTHVANRGHLRYFNFCIATLGAKTTFLSFYICTWNFMLVHY